MRHLFPHAAEDGSPQDLRAAYDVARPAPEGRPWVMLCMVSSLDGSTVVDNTSRGLSNPTDQALLLLLRTFADVILVGAATVREERYGPPRGERQRIAVVSRSGDLDYGSRLFTSGKGVVVLPEDAPDVPVESIRAGTGQVDLAAALTQMHDRWGTRVVQAEGGATLNGLLTSADLIDELNLTISPQLAGGTGPRLTAGAASVAQRMSLAHVIEDDGFLFTRYVRVRSGSPSA
ncbi:MAG TPA: dihydrofolate reductase family protein [Ilumatobacteraceae bacterium]|nr:dihydrofolate reductase family protein [Ilumatobacteraceae bacterium]